MFTDSTPTRHRRPAPKASGMRSDRWPLVALAAALLTGCGPTSTQPASQGPAASPTAGEVAIATGNPTRPIALSESGSSLILPYLQKLADPLHQAYSNITLAPGGGGSGQGVGDAVAGRVVLGGTDAFLTGDQVSANPGMLNIPLAVAS